MNLLNQLFASGRAPRIALVAAHPDDEAIGAGAQLRRWRHAQVIYVTDGAPRDSEDARNAGFSGTQEYAWARRQESLSALALAGIGRDQAHWLSFPDQGASFHMARITHELADRFRDLEPEVVVTHPFEGGHPDHDTTAFAVHHACRILQEQNHRAPAIVEMTSYHNRGGFMKTGEFLPGANGRVVTVPMSEGERAFKARLFDCFGSQQKVLQYFPIQPERFRPAPGYEFTQPPHAGKLFYELFSWGMVGGEWRRLAKSALREIASRRPVTSGFRTRAAAPTSPNLGCRCG